MRPKPALPNVAGGTPGPTDPALQTAHQGSGALPGPVVNNTVVYTNNGVPEDRAGADIAHYLGQMNQPTAAGGR